MQFSADFTLMITQQRTNVNKAVQVITKVHLEIKALAMGNTGI